MFRFVLIISFVHICHSCFSQEGTYSFNSKKDDGPSGIVLIHIDENNNYLFYLEFCLGEPSYNSRAYYGRLYRIDCLRFISSSSPRLNFSFDKDLTSLKVQGKTMGNVLYSRENNINPEYFIARTGEYVYFSKTSPEDYRE